MPIRPAASGGMTLIEVLVVVVIASVVATLVTLRLGAFDSTQSPRDQLREVAQAIDAVCEQALFRAKPQTLTFYAQGLIWNGADTPELVSWSEQAQPRLVIEGHATTLPKTPEPATIDMNADRTRASLSRSNPIPFHILCDPLGQRTAFELQMRQGERAASLVMTSDGQWQIESGAAP